MTPISPDAFTQPDGIYLLSHSIGLLPASAEVAVFQEFAERWGTDPAESWPRWLRETDGFREELGRLLNSEPDWICPQLNVSSATTKIIHSLPNEPTRAVIVYSERAFPSLGFVAEAARRSGFGTRVIPRDADTTNPAIWRDALSTDVGTVLVSHAESDTGALLPVDDIIDLARTRGVYSIIDVAQSAGVIPIDVTEWDADFVVGSSVKWLCGGPGAGFLWVNPNILDSCKPIDVGWFSHHDPFELDINHFRYADNALRFWGGTPSPLPAALARHSLALLNSVGIQAIHAHNRTLTDRLIDGVSRDMVSSPTEPRRRTGTVVIAAGEVTMRRAEVLEHAGVTFDQRSHGLRVSPHLYNTAGEIDAAIDILARTRT